VVENVSQLRAPDPACLVTMAAVRRGSEVLGPRRPAEFLDPPPSPQHYDGSLPPAGVRSGAALGFMSFTVNRLRRCSAAKCR
jgi:hypothetical protein